MRKNGNPDVTEGCRVDMSTKRFDWLALLGLPTGDCKLQRSRFRSGPVDLGRVFGSDCLRTCV